MRPVNTRRRQEVSRLRYVNVTKRKPHCLTSGLAFLVVSVFSGCICICLFLLRGAELGGTLLREFLARIYL